MLLAYVHNTLCTLQVLNIKMYMKTNISKQYQINGQAYIFNLNKYILEIYTLIITLSEFSAVNC